MDPRDNGDCMAAFVSSCPVSVYVIGWGSQPFQSYKLGATPLRVGINPRSDGGSMDVFSLSYPFIDASINKIPIRD